MSSAPAAAPRRSIRRRLAFGALAALVFLALLEGGLRLALPVARRATLPNDMIAAHLEGAAFRYDPDLYWYWPEPMGGPVNRYGFVRTKPMTVERPEGVTRVVTFGDSQTFGAGVSPDETYSAFAETTLGEGWEVLNAGISGYRTLNVYRLLQRRIEAFSPSAVVIDCMPFDSPRDNGPIVGRPLASSSADVARRLLWQSRIYYLLRLGLEHLNPDRPRWLDRAAARRPGDGDLGNHDRIAEWGEEHGVAVIFMEYAIMQRDGSFGCMTNPGELPPGHFVVPTCSRLAASGRPPRALFQDQNHLTIEGNRLVGEVVAETLARWRSGEAPPEIPVPADVAGRPNVGDPKTGRGPPNPPPYVPPAGR